MRGGRKGGNVEGEEEARRGRAGKYEEDGGLYRKVKEKKTGEGIARRRKEWNEKSILGRGRGYVGRIGRLLVMGKVYRSVGGNRKNRERKKKRE